MNIKLIESITQWGISEGDINQKKRSIAICNYISLLLFLGVSLIYIIRRTYYGNIPLGFNTPYLLIGFISSFLPLLMNRFYFTSASRIAISILPVLFVWYYFVDQLNQMQQVELTAFDSLRIFLLALSMIPFLIINRNECWLLIGSMVPSFLSFILFDRILDFFGVGLKHFGIQSQDYQLMSFRTTVAYLLIGSWSFIFHSIIIKSDKLNLEIQRQLHQKNIQVERQNNELIANEKKLSELNLCLENMLRHKTDSITLQAKKLRYLANSNAHYLRAPLARLMGLLKITRIDKEVDLTFILEKIEFEAMDINNIVKTISEELNDADLIKMEA